jgi:hypothetical protein
MSIFIDRRAIKRFSRGKYFYALTSLGVMRSEDPFFRTYKKINDKNSGIFGFSVLPTGLYINGNKGELLVSKDKGDTWQLKTKNGDILIQSLIAIDSINFVMSQLTWSQTKDFRTYSPATFNIPWMVGGGGSNFNLVDGYRKGKNIFIGPIYSIDSGHDTTYLTTVDVKPTYSIQKDTVLKPTELFEGRAVSNGEIITKSFKTKVWGCDSVINFKIQKLTPTEELPAEFSAIKVYPNPAKDYLSISYELKQAAWVEISLYNAVGQKVKILQKKVKNTEGGYQLLAEVKNLNSGTYQIEFQTEKGVYYIKKSESSV